MRSVQVTATHPRSLVFHGTHCYVTCDNSILKLDKTNGAVLSSKKVNNEIRGLDFLPRGTCMCVN